MLDPGVRTEASRTFLEMNITGRLLPRGSSSGSLRRLLGLGRLGRGLYSGVFKLVFVVQLDQRQEFIVVYIFAIAIVIGDRL